jgi:hypothetical protein
MTLYAPENSCQHLVNIPAETSNIYLIKKNTDSIAHDTLYALEFSLLYSQGGGATVAMFRCFSYLAVLTFDLPSEASTAKRSVSISSSLYEF